MQAIQNIYQFILELDKLKLVFRNTRTDQDRRESTAEHSWSVAMIIMTLMSQLKAEFGELDELKAIKLALIHDVVEIYAGDVSVYDVEARKQKQQVEVEALHKLMAVNPEFGQQLHDLWHEFENKTTIEAKIAKAADTICPMFQRLHARQGYQAMKVTLADFENFKRPYFTFSKTFLALYEQLRMDSIRENLITE